MALCSAMVYAVCVSLHMKSGTTLNILIFNVSFMNVVAKVPLSLDSGTQSISGSYGRENVVAEKQLMH